MFLIYEMYFKFCSIISQINIKVNEDILSEYPLIKFSLLNKIAREVNLVIDPGGDSGESRLDVSISRLTYWVP